MSGTPGRRVAVTLAVTAGTLLGVAAPASATLSFATAPSLPTLPSVTLDGGRQTTTAAMTDFSVDDTDPGTGWKLTVAGQAGAGQSDVFAQYCPASNCGSDAGPGYVPGGFTVPADSLTLNTSGASWTGGAPAPGFQCDTGCSVDDPSPVTVASAASDVYAGGILSTAGFSSTSLSLVTPTTVHRLQPGEVYRVDVVWTLSTGP